MALRNFEQKQRKYEEVRERLFGSPSASSSGASSSTGNTPPRQSHNSDRRGRGKSRGGGGGRDNYDRRDKSKRLYDPDSSAPRGNVTHLQRKDKQRTDDHLNDEGQQEPRHPIRNPRPPDASGGPGFGRV